jgi:O-antigen/teichoic acid export membrane protein
MGAGVIEAPPNLARLAEDLSVERLARGTRDNLAGALIERVLGLVLIVGLPLLLSPASLGRYYEALALLTIAASVATAGLDVGVTRFTALASERSAFGDIRRYVRVASVLGMVFAVACAGGIWLGAPWLADRLRSPDLVSPLRWGALGVPFVVLTGVLVSAPKGLKLMWPSVMAGQVIQPGVQTVAAIGLVMGGAALFGAVAAFTVAAAAAWIVAVVMFARLRLPTAKTTRPSVALAGPMLRFSTPVCGMVLAQTVLLWIDTLLLGAFRPATEVATYGLVVRLMTATGAALFTLIQAFGPFATQLIARGDRERLGDLLRTATRWTVSLAAPMLVFLVVAGDRVVALLGQSSAGREAAIAILGLGFMIDAVTGPVGQVLTMSGHSGLNLANNVGAVVANIGLNLLLIPRLGMIGAALSWAVALAGLNLARLAEVRILFGIGPFSLSLSKPLGAAAAAGLAALALRPALASVTDGAGQVLAMGAILVCAYAALMAAFGVGVEDRALLRALRGRGRLGMEVA